MTLRREYKLGKWIFNYLKLKGNGKAVNYWTVGIGIGKKDAIGSGDWGFTNVMFPGPTKNVHATTKFWLKSLTWQWCHWFYQGWLMHKTAPFKLTYYKTFRKIP